jgi:hypothetical protein
MGLCNWADDTGVGTANPRELLGFAFPNDEDLTVGDLRRMFVEIRRSFGVDFYVVAGRPYYAIPSWERHQKFDRRSKGKHPGPEHAETLLYADNVGAEQERRQDAGDSHEYSTSPRVIPTNTRRDSVAGTGEQGNRGTGEQEEKAPPPAVAAEHLFAEPEPEEDREPEPKAVVAVKPKSPEQLATESAYERVGKAFKFVAVLQIAKWAIHDRGVEPQALEDAIVAVYEAGKPITRQTVGQMIDGHMRPIHVPGRQTGGVSKQDAKVNDYLERGQRLANAARLGAQKEIS